MTSWHSYPKVYALGHRAINELFLDDVIAEEKVDGSQFSFGRFAGELKVRSKGQEIQADAPEKMFAQAVESVVSLPLIDGWTYRGEYLQKPKHNSLKYNRTPIHHVIIFDINTGEENYLDYERKRIEAERVGLEVVPLLYHGRVDSAEQVMAFLEQESILGGQKIEGIVLKNYHRFGMDKKVLMGKFVSEAFKEVHKNQWKVSNPSKTDVVQAIILSLRTEPRWSKAVQHLRESGNITDSPRDIGNIIKEIQRDVKDECMDEIVKALIHYALPQILRGVAGGVPEWYKEQLLTKQFDENEPFPITPSDTEG